MAKPEMEKLELFFKEAYRTKKKTRFDEELGEFGYSEREIAVGYIYPLTEAMELIGNPARIKVTIEPA